jgi:hypothetical protein
METEKMFYFDQSIPHPKIKNKKYDIMCGKSYQIYNCDNDYICINEPEKVTQCRSIIVSEPENQILSFSLPQKSTFQEVISNIQGNSEDLWMNEFIEGPMIHLFYDERRQSWEIAMKSSVGGHYPLNKYINVSKKIEYYVRTLFCEIFSVSSLPQIPCLEYLSKDHCYQFIMQHPKQDHFAKEARLYLISVFHICNMENRVKYIEPTNYIQWTCFQNTPILFPLQLNESILNTELEMEVEAEGVCIKNRITGFVIHNMTTGKHYIYKSKGLIEKNSSLSIEPLLFYRFLHLKQCNMVSYYLEWNFHHKKKFKTYQSYLHNIISSIYNHYVAFYITKTIDSMDEKYKYYLEELHHQYYLSSLAKKSRKPITKTIVYEYFFNLSPGQQLYACFYEKRANNKKNI